MSSRKGWNEIEGILKERLGNHAFERWFGEAKLASDDGQTAVIALPNAIQQYFIESNFKAELTEAVTDALGGEREVQFITPDDIPESPDSPEDGVEASEDDSTTSSDDDSPSEPQATDPKDPATREERRRIRNAGLNPEYSVDTFVVGGNSEFASAAAEAVVAKPGQVYNPLFLHGGVGLGKTHLLSAIGQACLARRKKSKVVYITGEDFTNELIEAIRVGGTAAFRKKYRKVDVLLIDDIQFLQNKESTQEEFFHTFNTLFNARKQIVVASDRAPGDLKKLEGRLVSRFEWGLTAELLPPDVETRTAILKKKMAFHKVKLEEPIIRFLAERIRKNMRRLEGAMIRLSAVTALQKQELTIASAQQILKHTLVEEAGERVTVDRIQRAVADEFDIRLGDMTSKRRPENIAFPRQIAMFLSRELTDGSLKDIGEAFGGRDHGTVIYACKKVAKKLTDEEDLRVRVDKIQGELGIA